MCRNMWKYPLKYAPEHTIPHSKTKKLHPPPTPSPPLSFPSLAGGFQEIWNAPCGISGSGSQYIFCWNVDGIGGLHHFVGINCTQWHVALNYGFCGISSKFIHLELVIELILLSLCIKSYWWSLASSLSATALCVCMKKRERKLYLTCASKSIMSL